MHDDDDERKEGNLNWITTRTVEVIQLNSDDDKTLLLPADMIIMKTYII